jgi:hypothetical protein
MKDSDDSQRNDLIRQIDAAEQPVTRYAAIVAALLLG